MLSSMLQDGKLDEAAVEYERSYVQEVLMLEGGETEEQMEEERLLGEARELGLEVMIEQLQLQKPLSSHTSSSVAPRRSESIDSRASQSTGLTSNFSEFSRDQYHPNGVRSARASLSFRGNDSLLSRSMGNGRHSQAISPPATPSQSTFSLPLSSPSSSPLKHFRRIRGLSMLKLGRSDSNSSSLGCSHCPRDTASQRRAVHKLPCGHRLCTQALRNTIKTATESNVGLSPSCCGVPIPAKLVEHVMTQEEQILLLEKLEQLNETESIAPSAQGEARDSVVMKRPELPTPRSSEFKIDFSAPHLQNNLEPLQDLPELVQLRSEQADFRSRFLDWIEKQREALEIRHERLRAELKTHHDAAIDNLLEHHANTLSEAEDKQVKAEADMRHLHSKEKQDNATALKHMEAYCAGTYSTSDEAHNRPVTDQDRAELEKTRRMRDGMDSKHESAINVLRGEQSRRMKLRAQRQDKELQELRRAQRKEELELERFWTAEMHGLDDFAAEKRKKLNLRWEVQTAVLARRIEVGNGQVLDQGSTTVQWQMESASVAGAARIHESVAVKEGISTGFAVSGQS